MKRPQLASSGTLARLFQTAEEARQRLDFAQCVEILERASRFDPANLNLLLNLGHAYGKNFELAAAEKSFERAIRLAPGKTEVLVAAAMRARDFGSRVMADRYYRLASEHKDVTPDIIVALAENSERLSRLDEATQLIERALALKPNFPGALLVRARLERQAGRLSEAEQILRSFPSDAGPGCPSTGWLRTGRDSRPSNPLRRGNGRFSRDQSAPSPRRSPSHGRRSESSRTTERTSRQSQFNDSHSMAQRRISADSATGTALWPPSLRNHVT